MINLTIGLPFQTAFHITTDCEELIGFLKLKYGKYVSSSKSINAKKIIVLKNGDLYHVEFENKISDEKSAVLAIDSILFENTVFDEAVFALHGAAVEYNGKAYLFLASTTSGKTTLASYLTSIGFRYITDDCILLSRDTFEVFPCSTPVHLRDGGIQVLQKLNALPSGLAVLDDSFIRRHVYTPENCTETPTPLGKIFFISRTENENQLAELNTTSRMSRLLHSPITVYKVTPEYLRFISSLAKTDCYELRYCDMDFVSQVIKNG